MRKLLLSILSLVFFAPVFSQTVVTNINAQYRNGQTFIKWKVIPGYTGFYYVYKYDFPITEANIDFSKYLGRVPHDFALNYFLDLGTSGGTAPDKPHRYLVLNQNPLDSLDSTKCCFVTTCTKPKKTYYVVTYDSASVEVRHVQPGVNATTVAVDEKVKPIEAILQIENLPLVDNPDQFYDSYAVFGGNAKTQYTPEFGNEGCLVFNFGMVPDDEPAGNNAATFFFFGGGGNAYQNANDTHIDGMWKISLEDVIPNFYWDAVAGENTKWIGYNENVDIYSVNDFTPPPTTGVDKTYTLSRVAWTRNWLLKEFPNDLDSTRMYVHGSSLGCTGSLTMSFMYPEWVAACDVVNAKLNAEYLGDDNPTCKWNEGGSSRDRAELFLGTLADNLPSDVEKISGEGTYKIWDWANFNNLMKDNKYNSLPVIFMTSGKEDNVTCWEEKIPFYNTVNQYRHGGYYYWDLRAHKGGNHSIKDLSLEQLFRYSTKLSYPGFSNCALNDDPGDENNPVPPFYDGDTIGSVNGVMDWVDSTISETVNSWETVVFTQQFELKDSTFFPFSGVPPHTKVDITPRRLQKFKNIEDGAIICMENWEGSVLKQSKSIVYHPNNEGNGLITFKKAKIRPGTQGGNLIKIYKCGSPKTTGPIVPVASAIDNVYPNPTSGNTTIDISMLGDANVEISVLTLLGEQVLKLDEGLLTNGEHQVSLDLTSLPQGMYIINVKAGQVLSSYKVIKE